MSGQLAPSSETLIATTKAYLKVFDALDPSTIEHVQTDSYKHQMAPASLGMSAAFTKQTFAEHLGRLSGALSNFPVTPIKIYANPTLSQVTMWVTGVPIFHENLKDGNPEDWNIKNEYIWVLTMDKSGEKVEEVLEFLDSKTTELLMPLVFRALGNKAKIDGTAESGKYCLLIQSGGYLQLT
jgi:hypothetical protein